MKKVIAIILLTVLSAGLTLSCSKDTDNSQDTSQSSEPVIAKIEMEDGGIITLELYPDIAPVTVMNFVKLVNKGHYDGVIFHRVMSGFMIQAGSPELSGLEKEKATTIKGEFSANGYTNDLLHERGVISMARLGEDSSGNKNYNSASDQFFIVHETSANNSASLDGNYAAFGKVIEGMDVVDRIAAVETSTQELAGNNHENVPVVEQRIKTITIVE